MNRRTWTTAAAAVGGAVAATLITLFALTSCTGTDDPTTPSTGTPTPSATASPLPATAAETAQQAFALLAERQQNHPSAITEACRYFAVDAYRTGPEPTEYGYEDGDEARPSGETEWPTVPMARWCGPDDAQFPEPTGKWGLDGQIPAIEEEERRDDGSRWVRVQFEGQSGMGAVPIERAAALTPQDDGTWRIERWCYLPLGDVEDPFTCLRRTQ